MYPKDLCADWAGGSVDLVDSVFDVRLLGVATLYAVLLFLLYEGLLSYASSRFRGELLIAVTLLVAPFVPATGLFMEVRSVRAMICTRSFDFQIHESLSQAKRIVSLRRTFSRLRMHQFILTPPCAHTYLALARRWGSFWQRGSSIFLRWASACSWL